MNAREQKMFDDHKIFMENRLEQQKRTQLYYILEQFHEHARVNADPNSKG